MISAFKTAKCQKQDARLQTFFWKTAEVNARSFGKKKTMLQTMAAERAKHKANDNQK